MLAPTLSEKTIYCQILTSMMLTCAVRGLCIVAVHTIEIVNSDVNIYQLLMSGFVLS